MTLWSHVVIVLGGVSLACMYSLTYHCWCQTTVYCAIVGSWYLSVRCHYYVGESCLVYVDLWHCTYYAEVTPKRNFYHDGHNLPIRIETSDRPSHQLVSRVLRILLLDVLGYAKVELVSGEADVDATRALNRFTRCVIAVFCSCLGLWP